MSAVLEVILIFIFIQSICWVWAITPLAQTQGEVLGWNYFSHIIFILIPVLILLLTKRSFKSYGLTLADWRYNLKWGLILAAALGIPALLTLIFGWLQVQPIEPGYLLSTLIFQILFVGFGEEILYRGYYQPRINEEYGRPHSTDGFKYGAGLIFISLLFGFWHVLNPFNPLQGRYDLDWLGLITLAPGFYLGFVREKTGSILAPAIIHGSLFWASLIVLDDIGFIAYGVGWLIAWILLFNVFSRTETEDQDLSSHHRPTRTSPSIKSLHAS